jgi:hypothetical protein
LTGLLARNLRWTLHYPGVPGTARTVGAADAALLLEWLVAFHKETIPHNPPPESADVERAAASERFLLWRVDDEPASVAAIARRLRGTGEGCHGIARMCALLSSAAGSTAAGVSSATIRVPARCEARWAMASPTCQGVGRSHRPARASMAP